jgi:TetR/AcrR family transcriptional regulator, tetracycline repressor protein
MRARTPLDREVIVTAALRLLNREGFEGLTLRRLAKGLRVQAAALYWHFKNKQELLDEMATQVFREGFRDLGLPPKDIPWQDWCRQFATAERQMLLRYREGAKMFSGTYLTDAAMYAPMEVSLQKLTADGFPLSAALNALSTIHCYVVGFTIEEQAVWPDTEKRDKRYTPERRAARLDKDKFPLTLKVGEELFTSPTDRFELGLDVILRGLEPLRQTGKRAAID